MAIATLLVCFAPTRQATYRAIASNDVYRRGGMTRTENFKKVEVSSLGDLRECLEAHEGQPDAVWLVRGRNAPGTATSPSSDEAYRLQSAVDSSGTTEWDDGGEE